MSVRGRGWVGCLAGLGVLAIATPGAMGAAVTFQGDGAHTGNVTAGFKPPLGKKWVRRGLGTSVSYPVIGDGKVFVTATAPSGPLLYALNRRTGGTVWVRPAPALGQPAYANGRVFVAGEGDLKAYSAASGQQLWLLDHNAVATPPVTDDQLVYAADSYSVNSFEQITGAPVATSESSADNYGSDSDGGIALDGDQVYSANGCDVFMFSKALGPAAWEHNSGCGDGTFSPAVHAGRVFARSTSGAGTVLDALLGLPKDSFTSLGAPAFSGNLAFYRGASTIQARRVDTGTIVWTRSAGGTGYGGSVFVVGGSVYALRADGSVVAFDRATGRPRWSRRLYDTVSGSSYYYSSSPATAGMAADSAGLIVPSDTRVTAFGPGRDARRVDAPDKFSGRKTKLTAKLGRKWAYYGQKVGIRGEVTRSGDSVLDHLELQAATYPYRIWRTVRRRDAYYGSYDFSIGPDRNTRYRVVDVDTAPMKVSHVMRVRAFIRFRPRFSAFRSGSFKVSARIDAPPWLHADKRPMYVYLLHSKDGDGKRVGHLPVRRRSGRGQYLSRGRIDANFGRTDYVALCLPIPRRHQLFDPAHGDCGKKEI